jgi:hypothetical protein
MAAGVKKAATETSLIPLSQNPLNLGREFFRYFFSKSHFKILFLIILNEVKDLNSLKMRDS